MMRARTGESIISLLLTPFLLLVLLVSLFGLVWLRSGIVSTAYELRRLEEQKIQAIKERKLLLASRADHMSIGKISAAFRENVRGNAAFVRDDSYFQNRVKVIHIQRNKEVVPYKTSLQGGKGTE